MNIASRAAMRLKLQQMYDADARQFAEAIDACCEDVPRHTAADAADLLHDLDDCMADDDGDTNYVYGRMSAVLEIARELRVRIDETSVFDGMAYVVTLKSGQKYRFTADDADHARDQAHDAEPGDPVLLIEIEDPTEDRWRQLPNGRLVPKDRSSSL